MTPIILICILHGALTSSLKDNNNLQTATNPFQDQHETFDIFYKDFDTSYYYDKHYDNNDSRRIFEWLHSMLNSNASEDNKKATTPKYDDVLDERIKYRAVERNLTVILTNLESLLKQILDVVKYARKGSFRSLNSYIPTPKSKRFKRNINETKVNLTNTNANKSEINEKDGVVKTKEFQVNGRRSFNMNPNVNNEVKERLLHYINEGFNEIKRKVESLKVTKERFSNDVNYKIGYIIANVDVLDTNMRNLKSDMDRNKYLWSDGKILNLYDTVKSSNNAFGNLLDILKAYVNKPAQ